VKNPKSEIRNPKGREPNPERRNPNLEEPGAAPIPNGDSDFWTWGDEPNADDMVLKDAGAAGQRVWDLQERTALFGEAIIRFAKKIPRNPVNDRLIRQLVGAGTSVGANYCEADDAVSRKEFKLRIGTCRKESKESLFFLRMIATAEESLLQEARMLWREGKALNLIFGSIWRK